MKPMFIWAGGKNKMLKRYSSLLPKTFDKYIEPFFGGGAMFVWAYNQNPNAEFVINDSNEEVMRIYEVVRDDVVGFKAKLDFLENMYLPLNKDDRKKWYYNLRHENAFNYHSWTRTQRAATLYFLMKTSFNGIWQVNKNTDGRYGTPFGLGNQTTSVYDREVIDWWHKALQNVTILSQDFEGVVRNHATGGSFVYMDPPYRGCFTDYEAGFDDRDQERVVECLRYCTNIGATAWASNRDIADDFFELKWFTDKIHYFDVTYTAGRRKKTQHGFKAKKAREILLVS